MSSIFSQRKISRGRKLQERRRALVEALEDRRLMAFDFHNAFNAYDVNDDGFVTPLDALVIINDLNALGTREIQPTETRPFIDVSRDNYSSSLDALIVITALNAGNLSDLVPLADGGNFLAQAVRPITLPAALDGSRTISFDITSRLNTTDTNALLEDHLLVYVVNPANPNQTLLDGGTPGSALFSLVGGQADFPLGLVKFDGKRVEIDVTDLPDSVALKFQLINSDGDNDSRFVLRSFKVDATPGAVASPLLAASHQVVTAGSGTDLSQLIPSSSVKLEVSKLAYDSTEKVYVADIVALATANVGRTVIVKFPNLPAGVELLNASGTDAAGVPYTNLLSAIPSGGLRAGSRSDAVRVSFHNPAGVKFALQPQVLVGPGNRAPVFPAIATQTVQPGGVLNLLLNATDPDGDAIAFTLKPLANMPTATLDMSGRLLVQPAPGQLGSFNFQLLASDGVVETSQTLTVNVVADPLSTTRIKGKILEINGDPLPNMRVDMGAISVLTAADGSFNVDLGTGPVIADTIKIRGELYAGSRVFPFIAEKLNLLLNHDIYPNVANVIERPIYLPAIEPTDGKVINPTQDTVVTSPALPGSEVFVEAGTLLDQQGTPFTGMLSLTEVPATLTPAALPDNLRPDMVVTIQPGDMIFGAPAPLTLPNQAGYAPGTTMDLWSINPVTGDFEIVGVGQVSDDGSVIETVEGGIRNSSWHAFVIPPQPETNRKKPKKPDPPPKPDKCPSSPAPTCDFSSEVDLVTGAVMESHPLVSYQSLGQVRGLSLYYDSLRADPRPIVRSGLVDVAANSELITKVTVSQGNFTYQVPGYTPTTFGNGLLAYPDLDGGEHFFRTPNVRGGVDYAMQLDLAALPTGKYDYTITSGVSQSWTQTVCTGISQRQADGSILCFGGTAEVPRMSYSTSSDTDDLLHINTVNSPFGSGWGISGLLEIVENTDGSVIVIDGDGSELIYESPLVTGGAYRGLPDDFTILVKQPDGRFKMTTKDQTVTLFNAQRKISTVTDRNGNVTTYAYNASQQIASITDPVGLQTTFAYTGARVTSIIDPAGRTTTLAYDAAGNLTKVTDPDSSSRTWSYDALHHMTSETDQEGRVEQAFYDFAGRATRAIRKDGSVIHVSPFETVGLARSSSSTDPASPAQALNIPATEATYSDGNGNVRRVLLNDDGRMGSSSDASGAGSSIVRNGSRLVIATIDGRGNATQYAYDSRGNVTQIIDEVSAGTESTRGTLLLGERDHFTFTLDAPAQMYFDWLTPGFQATLKGVAGPVFEDFESTFEASLPLSLLPAGQYTLTIAAGGSPNGEYEFRLRNVATAVPVSAGSNINGVFSPRTEAALYRLNVSAGDLYQFNATSGEFENNWRLVDPYGREVFNTSMFDTGSLTFNVAGTYTLAVESYGEWGVADYGFDVGFLGNIAPPPLTGTPIALASAVSGAISTASERDAYTFTLANATNLYFDGLTSDFGFQWSLVGPQGAIVNAREFGIDYAASLTELRLPAGTYGITVQNRFGETGDYGFRIFDLATATPLTLGDNTSGTLTPASATEAYKFNGTVGQSLYFDRITGPSSSTAYWRLFDPFGMEVFQSPFSDRDALTLTSSGDYTLLLEGYPSSASEGGFEFRVQPIANLAPVALTTDTLMQGALGLGQSQQYTFTLATDTDVYFNPIDRPEVLWSLSGPGGKLVDSRYAYWNDYDNQHQWLSPGTYTLTIKGYNGFEGDYAFRLDTFANSPLIARDTVVSGQLIRGSETDLLQFNGVAGEEVFFDMQNGGTYLTSWRLVGPHGDTVFHSSFYDHGRVKLPATGAYTLLVIGDNYFNDNDLDYAFEVVSVPMATVEALALGSPVNATLTRPGEYRKYDFTLAGDTQLYFDVLSANQNFRWSLDGPSGAIIDDRSFYASNGDYWSRFDMDRLLVPAGTYTLEVSPINDDADSFSFNLLDLAGGTLTTPGGAVTASLTPGSETDVYRFDAVAGERYFVDILPATQFSPFTRLLAPDGTEVHRTYGDIDTFNASMTGSYTLLIEGNFGETENLDYEFIIRPVIDPTPAALTLGAATTGAVAVGGTTAYTFTLSAQAQLTFDLLDYEGNLEWRLQGPAGFVVSNRALTSDWTTSLEDLNLPAGSYTLTIDGYRDATGTYTFRMLDFANATTISVDSVVSGALANAVETDLYRFTASAGDALYFDNQSTGGLANAYWRLLDPYGNQVFGQYVHDRDVITLAATGSYTLVIEGYIHDRSAEDTAYAFEIQPAVVTGPAPLTLGATANGVVATVGASTIYEFTLAAKSDLYFDSLTNNGNLSWTLEGPAGVKVSDRSFTSSDWSRSIDTLGLVAGEYRLTVSGYSDATGAYSFRLFDLATGTPLILDTQVDGTLTPANETDVFRFTGAAGDTLNFVTTESSNVANASWRLIDRFGTELFNRYFSDVSGVVLPNSGTYTLLVEGYIADPGTIDYGFELQFVENVPPVAVTGTALTLGTNVSGSLVNSSQRDVYVFTLASDSSLYFDGLSNNVNLFYSLQGPAGLIVNSRDFGTDVWESVIELPAGDYALTIGAYDAFDYEFRLLDLANATPLSPGAVMSGSLALANDTVAYRFTAAANSQYFFDVVTSAQMGYSRWRLLDPYNHEVFSSGVHDVDVKTLKAPGEYTLLVEGYYNAPSPGSFSFNVQPVAASAAEPLVLGAVIADSIELPGVQHAYTFTLAAAANLYFDNLNGEFEGTWKLVGPGGTIVDASSFNSWYSNFVDPLRLSAGEYTLTVDAAGDAIGDYAFRLFDLAFADVIVPGETVTGTLSPGNSTKAYKFTAAAGQFYFDALSTDSGYINWRLVDSYGVEVFYEGFGDSGTTQLTQAGTYTLIIEGYVYNSEPVDYSFAVRPVGAPTVATLTLGELVADTLTEVGGQKQYTFSLAAPTILAFDAIANDSSLSWSLRGPNFEVNNSFTTTTAVLHRNERPLPAGAYTLSIQGWNDSVGDFSFRLTDLNAATQILVDTEVSLPLNFGEESRFYRFDATAGEKFYFDWSTENYYYYQSTWRLFDPNGRQVFHQYENDIDTLTLTKTGSYTLIVDVFNDVEPNERSFTVRSVPTTPALPLTLGVSTTAVLNTIGREQQYTFTLDTAAQLFFDALPGEHSLRAVLRGPDNTVVLDNYFSSSDVVTKRLRPGTYSLTIDGYYDETGTYGFKLLNTASAGSSLAVGVPQTSNLTIETANLHRFSVETGGKEFLFSIASDGIIEDYYEYYQWKLVDGSGNTVFQTYNDGSRAVKLPHAGEYTLIVGSENYYAVAGSYTVQVQELFDSAPVNLDWSAVGGKSFTYDPVFNQLTSSTDELGRTTLFDIDPANGNRRSVTQVVGAVGGADDAVTSYTYTSRGLVDLISDPLGRVTDFDYDVYGRVITATYAKGTPDQAIRRFEYSTLSGNVSAMIDERGNRTEYLYDALNRVTRITEADPDAAGPLARPVTQHTYDKRGNLTVVTDALLRATTTTYDVMDRAVRITDATGQFSTFQYDANGNVLVAVDPLGQRTTNRYDARNRLVEMTDANGATVSFAYDANDQLISVTDALGNTTRYEYDSRGRLVSEIDPLGKLTTNIFDVVNRLVSKTDRNARTTEFAYDGLDRRIRETWVGDSNELLFSYDMVGNLLTASDDFSSLTFTYDALNRVKQSSTAGTPAYPNVALAYSYDAAGNVLSLAETINGQAGATTGYTYDALNRTTRLTQTGGGTASKRVDLAYNALSQYTGMTRFADLAGTTLVASSSYTYDGLNRLSSLTHNKGAATLASYAYTYDTASRITSINSVDGLATYTYDSANQLVGAQQANAALTDETYEYDANGNRVETHASDDYETGTGNRLLTDGTFTYTYDDEGNLVRRTLIATGAYREFAWDFRNRLIAVTDKTAADVPAQRVEYTYDVLDRRIAKAVDATPLDANDAVVTNYVYDGDDVLLDFVDTDGSGPGAAAFATRYLHGPQVDQVLAQDSGGSDVQWLLTDHLGTTRDLVSNSGVLLNHIVYDSFGKVVSQTNATIDTRYLFTGREFDSETNLGYYRARYYDTAMGRFIGEDPIAFNGGDANLYRYVRNSPLNATDPTGQFAHVLAGAAFGGLLDAGLAWATTDYSCMSTGEMAKDLLWTFVKGAGLGAVTGGIGHFGKLGTLAKMGVNATVNAGASAGIQQYNKGDVNWGEVAESGALGALGTSAKSNAKDWLGKEANKYGAEILGTAAGKAATGPYKAIQNLSKECCSSGFSGGGEGIN